MMSFSLPCYAVDLKLTFSARSTWPTSPLKSQPLVLKRSKTLSSSSFSWQTFTSFLLSLDDCTFNHISWYMLFFFFSPCQVKQQNKDKRDLVVVASLIDKVTRVFFLHICACMSMFSLSFCFLYTSWYDFRPLSLHPLQATNLGGLCRTCEIFNAELVLGDPSYITNTVCKWHIMSCYALSFLSSRLVLSVSSSPYTYW